MCSYVYVGACVGFVVCVECGYLVVRLSFVFVCFFFSSRRRHTRCALVTGVQTCALPILATAWSKQHDFVASTIVGVSAEAQLDPILDAIDLVLTDDVMKALNQVGKDILYPMG